MAKFPMIINDKQDIKEIKDKLGNADISEFGETITDAIVYLSENAGGGSKIYLAEPTNVNVKAGNAKVTITWTDPDDVTLDGGGTLAYWKGTVVVRKEGSAPASVKDGTIVVDNTTKNQYSTDGYVDTDVENDKTYYYGIFPYSTDNAYTVSAVYSATPKSLEIVTWANGTDEQIKAMLEAHYNGDIDVSEYWAVGDSRTVSLSSFSSGNTTHVAQDIQMTIIDFKHDDLVESINGVSKAAITVNTKSLLGNAGAAESEYYWGSSHYPVQDNENYSGSPLRTKLNTDFINAMPSTFASMIKSVVKKNFTTHTKSSKATVNTTDKAFLLSYPEVFGTATYSYYKEGDAVGDYEGTQYKYFETASNRVKYWNNNGVDSTTAYHYWLRSPSSYYNSTYGYYWCYVNSSGSARSNDGDYTFGLALALCL